jgi:hypothetical protein
VPKLRSIIAAVLSVSVIPVLSVGALKVGQCLAGEASTDPILAGRSSEPSITGSTTHRDDTGAPYHKRVEPLHRLDITRNAQSPSDKGLGRG